MASTDAVLPATQVRRQSCNLHTAVVTALTPLCCRLQLLYFNDTFALEHTATVLRVAEASGADTPQPSVVVDATVFYPAGGGQSADMGHLLSDSGDKVAVTDVKLRDGLVLHILETLPAWLTTGARVKLRVDGPTRLMHARIHSAGHLLDVCMARCGYDGTALVPTKGMHSPAEAYVEYSGKVPPEDQEPLVARLNAALAAAVEAGGPVRAGVHAYDEAAALCGGSLPTYIAQGSTPRVVVMEGAPGCPCGGTHVNDVRQVGAVTVTGVRVKKGVTRISYTVT